MSGYRLLLQKRLFHNKLNLILLILLIITTLGCLWLNHRTTTANSQITQLTEEVQKNQQLLREYRAELSQVSSIKKKHLQQTIAELEKNTQIKQQIIQALNAKKWNTAYSLLAKENQQILAASKTGTTEDFIEALKRNILLYRYLAKHELAYVPTDFSTDGVNFLAWVSNYLIPYFLTLILAFMLTNFYLLSYRSDGKIDIDALIPGKTLTKQALKIIVGFIATSVIFISYLLLSFISATIFFGSGSLAYPYIVYTAKYTMHLAPLSELLLKSLPLQLLALLSLCLLFYVITLLVKNKLAALFIALLLSVGLVLGITTLDPIQQIAPFIPTTYLNSFSVATGFLPRQLENFQISLKTGYLVVTGSLVLLSLLAFILNKLKNIKK